jgi:anti-sigma regulatory factor (Ser/Thr protein kinase)
VADILSDWQLPQLRERAVLAVSELVTNALVHTTSRIRLTLRHSGAGRVWIGVHDTSDRPPHPRTPTPLEDLSVTESVLDPSHLDIGGRGLTIVGHLADSWGVTPSSEPGGKTIWIELATSE